MIFILTIHLLFSQFSMAEKCSDTPTATINVSLDYSEARQRNSNGDWVIGNRLTGVTNDRQTMRTLSSKLFQSDSQIEFTDQDIALDTQFAENTRELFLNKIKKFTTNFRSKHGENSKLYLNISTHGIRCKNTNGDIFWGIIVPPKKLILSTSAPQSTDPEYLFNCDDETFKKMFVSANDIASEISPDGLIIDTCYSGEFEKNIISTNLNFANKKGLFIFTSALNNMVSEEVKNSDHQNSGVLFESLNRIIKSPQICSLDIDQDGELSQEEIGFYLLSVYTTLAEDELPIKNLLSRYHQLENKKQTNANMNYNLGTAKIQNKCLYKLPSSANCPLKETLSNQPMTCSEKQNSVDLATDRLKDLISNKNLTFVNLKSRRRQEPSAISRNLIDITQSNLPPKVESNENNQDSTIKNLLKSDKFYIDHRRAEAINFFGAYLSRQTSEVEKLCGLNPTDAQCHSGINALKELKNDLYKILTLFKEM